MIRRLVIFGAAGDLTSRKLIPDLARLRAEGSLPEGFSVLGVSQEDWTDEQFRRHIGAKLDLFAADVASEVRSALVSGLEYRPANVTRPAEVASALGRVDEPIVAYLALPPAVAGPTVSALAALGLPEGSRVVAEKPFGTNLATAKELNRLLHSLFPEREVFRLDHFLGKQTVQNVLGLRFANRVFEPLWNRDHIERVEIAFDETITLEGRAGYYDRAGALRDMVQNHLLQLLCLVGMEPPATLNERDLRDRKVELLRAVRKYSPEEVERHTVRARYTAGTIGDRAVPDYVAEPRVEPGRETETYAQVTLYVDNWRWAGVPFVLRSGKALSCDCHHVDIYYRPVPHLAFEVAPPRSNRLRLTIDPDRMELDLNINGHGDPFDLEQVELETQLAPPVHQAYARLLLDLLAGDSTLSIRADEAEEAWRIIEPIADAWKAGRPPLLEYPAGSEGPEIRL